MLVQCGVDHVVICLEEVKKIMIGEFGLEEFREFGLEEFRVLNSYEGHGRDTV